MSGNLHAQCTRSKLPMHLHKAKTSSGGMKVKRKNLSAALGSCAHYHQGNENHHGHHDSRSQ